jgi:hypothetical protein
VVYRLTTNGVLPNVLWAIANTYRKLPKEWTQGSCRQSINRTMDKAGYKNWRLTTQGDFNQEKKSTWDDANLDVAGFLPPGGGTSNTPTDIPFKSLAVDLRSMPQGHDALDLTRMVEYCAQNPHEPWFYPRDYDRVLQLVGGAATVIPNHSDGEASKRWTGVKPPPATGPLPKGPAVADKKKRESKRKRTSGADEDMVAFRRRKENVAPSTGETPVSETEQEPQEPRPRPRKTVRIEEELETEENVEEESEEDIMVSASRQLARTAYAAPPEDSVVPWETALAMSLDYDAMNMTFESQGQVGETDPYSAYAFGGPRHAPPYRPLYRIGLPDPSDMSGWAENLRWAFEQNTFYRYPDRADAWNESSEHMELIVQIRIDRYWMSEEFEAQIED